MISILKNTEMVHLSYCISDDLGFFSFIQVSHISACTCMHIRMHTDTGFPALELLVCAAWAQINSLIFQNNETLSQIYIKPLRLDFMICKVCSNLNDPMILNLYHSGRLPQ